MLRIITTLCMIITLATMVTACSSGGGPMIPEGTDGSDLMALPIYANPTPEGMFSGMAALGVYQVSLNTDNMSYEITTERMTSFVPTTHEVDLTTALTSVFCKDCFVIKGLTLSAGNNIMVEVGLKHPFPQVSGLPATKPERADLHVFDVQGIVVIEGSKTFPDATITLNPNFVLNADGYTTAFDGAIDSLGPAFSTTANCHPFKILSKGTYNTAADEIGNYDAFSMNGYPNPAGILNPTGFNVLKGGKGWNNDYILTQYELKPTGTSVDFFFVVTCAYGQAGKKLGTALQQRDNPIYLLPAFSKPEAWRVNVEVENNILADNDNTSTAEIVVRACDWQEAYAANIPNPAFDPAVDQAVPRNTVFNASDIDLVEIEIPGLLLNPVDSSTVTPSGNGSYTTPKTYRMVVNNETFASEISGSEPQFWGLVAVRDDLAGTTNPTGGIKRGLGPTDAFGISDYTTYQVFGISIYPPNDRPTPVITVNYPAGPPYNLISGDTVNVDGLASFDTGDDGIPGGVIIAYEWDFDYDPVTEIFALSSDPEYWTDPDPLVAVVPPLWALDNPTAAPVSKFVALRVTDGSLGAAKEVTYVEIVIGPNQPPTADLGVAFYDTDFPVAPYTFYEGERVTLKPGTGCSDDGAIVTYQYDFDYVLASGFMPPDASNSSGAPVITPPQVAGPIDMGIRVIDNGIPNLNDIDTKTLTILGPAVDVPIQVSSTAGAGIDTTSVGYHALAEGTNTIMCVWTQEGTQSDIFYAVYDKVGTMAWGSPSVLNAPTSATQENPALCVDPATDTYYVAFKDNSSNWQILVAVSNPGGSGWSSQTAITSYPITTPPDDPSICFAPGVPPTIAVAYSVSIAGNKQIMVQTSPDGVDWTSPAITVNSDSTIDRTDPVICFYPSLVTPQIGVAWDDSRVSSKYEIYFNFAPTSTMVFQPADILVASDTGSLMDPSLTSDGTTWMISFDNLSATSEIYFTSSTLGTAGTWTLTPVDVTDSVDDSQHNNSGICVDGLGTIYITCRDSRETGIALQADIYVFKSEDGGSTWVRGVKANDRSGIENNQNVNILGLQAGGFIVMYTLATGSYSLNVAHSNAY